MLLGLSLSLSNMAIYGGGGGGSATTKHIVIFAQSEIHREVASAHKDLLNAGTVVDEDALEIWWYDLDTSSPNNAIPQPRSPITNANKVSRWAVELSNKLASLAPGVKFKVCLNTFSGTGLDNLLNDGTDATAGRWWTRPAPYIGDYDLFQQFLADCGISQPDGAFMAWQNLDSLQTNFGTGAAWWTALTGTNIHDGSAVARGATINNVTFDHFITDMFDTDVVPFGFAFLRFDILDDTAFETVWDRWTDIRVSIDRMLDSPENQARALPFRRITDFQAYLNGYHDNNTAHPSMGTDVPDGAIRFTHQLAYNIVGMSGAVATIAPKIDTVAWTAADLTLSSAAGDITTTRTLRGGVLPAGQPKIEQLFFRSAGAPEVRVEVPDAAISLTGGSIVIDAAAMLGAIGAGRTTFQRGDMIEFSPGSGGTLNLQDQADDTWLDYAGIAHPELELIGLRGVGGVMSACDLGAAPALTNIVTLPMASWAEIEALVDQGGGWYRTYGNVNPDFASASGEIDLSGATIGVDTMTVVVDVDREIGLDGGTSAQISVRDLIDGTTGGTYGHQRLLVNKLWKDPVVSALGDTIPTQFGLVPLPGGRCRIWGYVSYSGGKLTLYANNNGTGGAYGAMRLFNGQLTVEQIAAM